METAPEKKTVTFIQNKLAALKAEGEYTLCVSQDISGTNEPTDPTYSATKTFVVKAERFTFRAGDFHSVFPPANYQGDFSRCFAHVVLTRPMHPWIRAVDASREKTPWLAVLLFDEDEAPSLSYGTNPVGGLIPRGAPIALATAPSRNVGTGTLPSGVLSYPFNQPVGGGSYVLDYGEQPTDLCQTIDVPVELFNAIVPSLADLRLLSHVRQVQASAVEVSEYSVVVGNRIPEPGKKSVVHLVSLEGMGPYLPENDSYASNLPASAASVRLVSLRTWSFSVIAEKESFKGLLENLEVTSLQIPTPVGPPSPAEVTTALSHQQSGSLTAVDADVLVRNAFNSGYSAMNHRLRDGGNTVSWYRGPLLPIERPLSGALTYPLTCSDEALRYDPETGLFDVSYAAAWQLGQLLSLQSKTFSLALYQWKKSILLSLADRFESAKLAESYSDIYRMLEGIARDERNKVSPIIELIGNTLTLEPS